MDYTKVTAQLAGNLLSAQLNNGLAFGGRTIDQPWNLPSVGGSQLYFGTGSGKINLLAVAQGTLTAATVNIDLTAIPDPFGVNVNFARVKGIWILNFATADGSILKAGAAATNPWASPFNGTGTSIISVPPGWIDSSNLTTTYPGEFLLVGGNATALAVSGTSKVLKLDSGAATITYAVALLGCDA